jgi:thiol-disulfide isomerase/thioredoxin
MDNKLVLLTGFMAIALTANAVDSPAGELFKAVGIQEVTVNQIAPAFELPTIEGQALDSADLRGKVVLVNFWATWCGPCREEMPAMQRLQQALPSPDFRLDRHHDRPATKGDYRIRAVVEPVLSASAG